MRWFCCVWIGCVLWACNDPQQTDLLFRAERMLESSPDSSLMLLKEIDPEQLDRAHYASYALLYTEALDKSGKQIISDSLLNVALEYYGKKGNSVALAKCYYYLGCYHWELEEWNKAIDSYVYAESIALDFSAYNLLGLIYGRLGRLYTQQFNIEKALDMYSRSVCCYDKVGNQKNKAQALGNRGRTFLYTQQYDSAVCYLELAEKLHRRQNDSSALSVCLNLQGYLWLKSGDIGRAKKVISLNNMSGHSALRGEVFLAEKQLDSAEYYLHLALSVNDERQRVGLYQRLADIARMKGEKEKVIDYLFRRCAVTDSVYQGFVKNSVEKWRTHSRYERAQKEAIASRLKAVSFQRLLGIVIVMFLIVVSVYQFLHSRKRKKLYEYRFLIQQLQISEANLKNLLEQQLEEKSEHLRIFFERRVDILKNLTGLALFDVKKLREKLPDIELSPEDWQLLKEGLNISMNGVVECIENDHPDLTEDDRRYCYLYYARFSAQEIAVLLNVHLDSIYKKRNRIRQRLHLENGVTLEDFLEELRRKFSTKKSK
ncbi:MAG: tetratricopeptide repeat protein [Odoribacter sp.]|nr:tetratricopeptide repeat protein [Odoribacter sp.]